MKKILLIGGTSGIGLSLAASLKEAGHSVITMSRKDGADFSVDVNNWNEPLPNIEESLDGFVYLPGTINLKPFASLRMEDFETDMKTNYFSAVRCVKNYLPNLKKNPAANMVFMSSVAASLGLSFHSSISAAKGAIEGFALALAAELAPNIRVNVVAPSLTDTPLAAKLLDTEEKKQNSFKKHPLQSIGEPNDIASMILFLLSDQAKWITGQTFHVDGGFSTLRQL